MPPMPAVVVHAIPIPAEVSDYDELSKKEMISATVRRLLVRGGLSIFLPDTPVPGSASSVVDLKRKHQT